MTVFIQNIKIFIKTKRLCDAGIQKDAPSHIGPHTRVIRATHCLLIPLPARGNHEPKFACFSWQGGAGMFSRMKEVNGTEEGEEEGKTTRLLAPTASGRCARSEVTAEVTEAESQA